MRSVAYPDHHPAAFPQLARTFFVKRRELADGLIVALGMDPFGRTDFAGTVEPVQAIAPRQDYPPT